MIQNVKLNSIAFKGENTTNNYSQFKSSVIDDIIAKRTATPNKLNETEITKENIPNNEAENVIEKKSVKERINNTKHGALNLFKRALKLSETAKGTLVGIKNGIIAMGVTALVGKNIQQAKGQIGQTITGIFKDSFAAVGKVVKNGIPFIWNNSLKEILKSIGSVPSKFFKYCSSGVEAGAKGSKIVPVLSILAGAGALMFGHFKGRLKGNHKGAEVDHYTNTGHIKS